MTNNWFWFQVTEKMVFLNSCHEIHSNAQCKGNKDVELSHRLYF